MHVAVLGAGVVGVTTAYYLARDGLRVTVVERNDEAASGTSHANGGQLSYSFTDALGRPRFVASLPRLALGLDPAVRIRGVFSPALARWGIGFLEQCTSARARQNTLAVLEIALRSAKLMNELRRSIALEFAFRPAGKLVLLRGRRALAAATQSSRMKRLHGCDTEILDIDAAGEIEPAVRQLQARYVGAVYSRGDEVGDARAFTVGLSAWLDEHANVSFRFGTTVKELRSTRDTVKGVETSAGIIDADAVVVCLGAWSSKLLKPFGIDPRIYPVRGYSITLPATAASPSVSLTDPERKIVFSRLDGSMRIAGFADFTGFMASADRQRVGKMLQIARRLAPQAADYGTHALREWGGFRPMTPSGRPQVGATPVRGLYLNTGHGMLGWTLAAATAHDVARSVRKASRQG